MEIFKPFNNVLNNVVLNKMKTQLNYNNQFKLHRECPYAIDKK